MDKHSYNTRDKTNFILPQCRLTKTFSSYECVDLKLFNKLPDYIKDNANFKKSLKIFLLQNCFYSLDEFYLVF